MTFSVSEFSSKINRYGVAKNNLFHVRMTPPAALGDIASQFNTRDIQFFCRAVDLPDMNVETTDVFQHGIGKSSKRPSGFHTGDLSTVFMVDSGFRVKEFFHRWIQSVFNYNTDNMQGEVYGKLPYEIGYKQDYVSEITVTAFSSNIPDQYYSYHFKNAFPTTVGAVSLAWENQNDILTMPVIFAHDGFTPLGARVGEGTSSRFSRGTGLIERILDMDMAYQTIRQFDMPESIQDAVNQYTTVSSMLRNIF